MHSSENRLNKLKKHLIFHYGSLVSSAKVLGFSYHRLVNILSSRTVALPEEIQRIEQVLQSHHLDGADEEAR